LTRLVAVCVLASLSLVGPVSANDDALPIIREAFDAARANEAIARNYVFHERIEDRHLNKKGQEKKRESMTYDVTLLDHSEYRRLIEINDKPLQAKTAAREQRKIEKQIDKMRNETPKQRRKRLVKVEKGREEGEKFLEEITQAFDFRLIGEEDVNGVVTHVISAEPRAGYKPTSREAKVLSKVRGTLWISRDDHAWVKADLETTGNITWLMIFKLREGARIKFTQRKVNDEVWLGESYSVNFRAKMALVVRSNHEIIGHYSNYRKFTTDSTDVHGGVAP
jgi:hypothetical protein